MKTCITLNPSGRSGFVTFPDGTTDNFVMYADGEIEFDKEHPEARYQQMCRDVRRAVKASPRQYVMPLVDSYHVLAVREAMAARAAGRLH